MLRNLLLFLGITVFVASCSTKVELNAEWRDTTVVFGLLDQKEDYHYIKINKAFLGGGNYYDYAMIRDSSEYANVNAKIEELNNGVLVNTYILRDTELVNKPIAGAFYAPAQTVFYFKKTGLNELNTYRLVANINEGAANAKEVSAETKLIEDFSIVNLASISLGSYDGITSTYTMPFMKFTPPASSDYYEILWRIKWDEYTATDTIRKTYEWLIGKANRTTISSSGLIEFQVSGEAFYKTFANVLVNDPAVTRRVFRAIDVIVYAASEDLNTYISVNAPQTGLVQERPEFTNINNGLGLFTSRIHKTMANKHITLGGWRELCFGPYTGGFLFCSDSLAFVGSTAPNVVCP